MSNWLHYHPDAYIYIRDAKDVPLYAASVDDFAKDFGSAFPLPAGIAQLELFEGRVYGYDAKHNELDLHGKVDPAPYQAIVDALPALKVAEDRRLHPPAPPPTDAQVKARLEGAVQAFMDASAHKRGYDDLRSAISYRGDKNATWATEADAFFAWRSDCWAKCIAVQKDVVAGVRVAPTVDVLIAELPKLPLP